MGHYKATILILNWNGVNLLKRCLPTVVQAAAFDGGGHEIMVVDNGSTDGSVQFVLDNFPGVAVLPLPVNKGFVGGYNEGLVRARLPWVVLLNNSTWVRSDFLTQLLVHFRNPDVFAVSPRILMPDGRIEVEYLHATWDARGFIGQHQPGLNETVSHTEGPCYTFYAPGGCSAFCREKFGALGWFHPIFAPFHWEEVDISYRAWKRGWKVLHEPRAIAWHEAGRTFRSFVPGDQSRVIWLRNRLLFMWSNFIDPKMVGQHHSHLQVWAAADPSHRLAYAQALQMMPQAEQKRYNDQPTWALSDPDVFNLIGACCSGPRPNGSLVLGNGGVVYLLEAGKKRPLPSMAVLQSFSDWAHVIPVSDRELTGYASGPQVGFRNGTLIESPERATYLVDRGTKRIVASPERLSQLGRSVAEIIPAEWVDIRSLPDGPPA